MVTENYDLEEVTEAAGPMGGIHARRKKQNHRGTQSFTEKNHENDSLAPSLWLFSV